MHIEGALSERTLRGFAHERKTLDFEILFELGRDIDDQADTPLAILRGAVEYPTEVLRRAGVPPVERDEFARRSFPTDVYGLAPANLADVAPELAEPGLVWGAAKAHAHLARRRREAT